MASTQEEWFLKLKSWVPQWFFHEVENSEAIFYGIAKVLERMECELDNHVTETYICTASDGFLDEHGYERTVFRQPLEFDSTYAERIKNITNSTSCPTIKQIVDALLDVGECEIVEDFEAALFFDRETFFNRGQLMIEPIYNTFSVIVDKQVHAPYSFYDREYFTDREDFIGTNESSNELFNLIIQAVNDAKALGTLYRLVERVE